MITVEDYFGRMSLSSGEEPSAVLRANAAELLGRVNALLAYNAVASRLGLDPEAPTPITSGWRTPSYNALVRGASATSKHMTAQAVDIADPEGALDHLLFDDWEQQKTAPRTSLLETFDLYMEHPAATKGWCHLQSVPPRSGNRVFFP